MLAETQSHSEGTPLPCTGLSTAHHQHCPLPTAISLQIPPPLFLLSQGKSMASISINHTGGKLIRSLNKVKHGCLLIG